jgi:hypothetical protein
MTELHELASALRRTEDGSKSLVLETPSVEDA